MTSSRYPQITDELLSAYIDKQVTDDEKALIETAVAEDPRLAWQLESLRYTVDLLHTLPQLALPRSFVLSDAQLVDGAASMPALTEPARVRAATVRRALRPAVEPSGFGVGWRNFWQMGNLFLRNAAAASLAIFLLVSAGGALLEPSLQFQTASQPVLLSDAPAAVPTALITRAEQAVAKVQMTTTQARSNAEAGSEAVVSMEQQAESRAARFEVIASPLANRAQPTTATSDLPPVDVLAQTAATSMVNGQTGGDVPASADQRSGEPASSPSDRPDNSDFAPSEPQALSSPLFTMAATSGSSAASSLAAPVAVVTDSFAANSAAMTDAITVTVVLSSSTVVSVTEPSFVSMPVTSSLVSETDAFSESLPYSATIVDATISPTSNVGALPAGEPNRSRYGPIFAGNTAANAIAWLRIFQLASALAALLLGVLWWRSRSTSPETH